jgi:hypothetical protein
MNKNKLILISIFALIIVGSFFVYKINKKESNIVPQNTNTQIPDVVKDTTSKIPVPTKTEIDPWTVFSDYLLKAKNHDIAGVGALSYKLSATCLDIKQKDACFVKMDNLYKIGSLLKKEDFVNRLEDNKQMILSTNLIATTTYDFLGYTKASIIFVKTSDGNLKVLVVDPFTSWTVPKSQASTTAELKNELDNLVKDSDKDGLTDQFENCIFPQNIIVTDCKKTDPMKRDSLGDGWWDGVREYTKR